MLTGIIFDLMRFSTRDGPGIRTTVFMKGCPLACLWCHNPESQRTRPELIFRPNLCINCLECIEACNAGCITIQDDILTTDLTDCTLCETCVNVCVADAREVVGREMTVAEVMKDILKDRAFYEQSKGGVTFSGGEPLMQNEFLLGLLLACKAEEIHTTIDTCGYAPWETLDSILPYVNLFLYDLKSIDNKVHLSSTGVSNTIILSNLIELSQRKANIRVRIPVIPGINDNLPTINAMGEFLSALPHPIEVELLPYHSSGTDKYLRLNRPYALEGTLSPSSETMQIIAVSFRKHGLTLVQP